MQHSDNESSFKSKKKHEEHLGGGSHGVEMGWLVSYADMMTLLFGLFVILYSMSTNKKGDYEFKIKQMGESFSGVDLTQMNLNQAEKTNLIRDMQKEIQKLQSTKATMIPKEQLQSLSTQLSSIQSEKSKIETELKALQAQIEDQKKIENEKIMKQTQQERSLASVQSKLKNETNTSEELKKQLEQITVDSKKTQQELEETKEQLAKKIEEINKISESEAKNNFLLVTTTWNTEKHDIDMEITTPSGHKFNYKKKTAANDDSIFEVDSRMGPGLEMWKTPKAETGIYKVKVGLYNTNGNENPANVTLSLINSKFRLNLPSFDLKTGKKSVEFKFEVNDKNELKQVQ